MPAPHSETGGNGNGDSLLFYKAEAKESIMANQTSRGRAQDRARVAAGQDHEVRYEAKKEGVSKQKVKDAVREVGNSRRKVEAELEQK
jgi:hypothetical protein